MISATSVRTPAVHQPAAPSHRVPEAIRRVFLETFTARDIAEPLASFDADTPCSHVCEFMKSRDFDLVGIRRDGLVTGYAMREALQGEYCGQFAVPVADAAVREDTTPIPGVLFELDRAPFLLISLLGSVGGIVTRADLQKPAIRMWLFGIVTLIEMRFGELIERYCPTNTWMSCLSESRLQKARELLSERQRRNQAVRLFDCLQFSDKITIVARHEEVRKLTVFTSRRQAEAAGKELEQLRNTLAHAQEIGTSDWSMISRLCEFIAR